MTEDRPQRILTLACCIVLGATLAFGSGPEINSQGVMVKPPGDFAACIEWASTDDEICQCEYEHLDGIDDEYSDLCDGEG